MSRGHLFAACASAVGVGSGVFSLALNGPTWWSVLIPVNLGFVALNLHLHRKERHGSDRRAEAGSQDSGTGDLTYNVTVNQPGITTGAALNALLASSFATGGVVPKRDGTPALETVESDMPILAHRIARLRFDGKRPFVSLNEGIRFGLDADAVCTRRNLVTWSYSFDTNHRATHVAPGITCGCGFYALPSDVDPWDDGSDYVTLLVELSGVVIEHEKGYRAEHQRVVECQVPPCPYCLRQADFVLAEDQQMTSVCCRSHLAPNLPAGVVAVHAADLHRLVGVPVTRCGSVAEAEQQS